MRSAFIYIVESPSAADIYDGRTEGRALCEALKLAGIPYEYTVAVNLPKFVEALSCENDSRLIEAAKRFSAPPVVHLSMHGNGDGIGLTDGTLLQWHHLQQVLRPINEALPDGLLVTFSTCEGASSMRMSMREDETKPFWATVGSFQSVKWDDALVAFLVFFHNWFKGGAPEVAANLMRLASGHNGFVFTSGVSAKADYRQYVTRQRIIEALTNPPPSTQPSSEPQGLAGLFGLLPATGTEDRQAGG